MDEFWKKCNFCRKEIAFAAEYYECSVSTCNRKRTGLVFCSVSCWDGHSDSMRHRDGWAVEEKAPSREAYMREQNEGGEKSDTRRRVIIQPSVSANPAVTTDVLVVASKVKQYIRDSSGCNTSAALMDVLTRRVTQICDAAVRNAEAEGRKTVMDRDVPPITTS